MQTPLALIGAIFLILSVIVFSVYLREGEARAKEAAWGALLAVWVLISFGLGSWLISLLLGGLRRSKDQTGDGFLRCFTPAQ